MSGGGGTPSKLQNAQIQAEQIEKDWKQAKDTVCIPPNPATGADFDHILPTGYDANAQPGAVAAITNGSTPSKPTEGEVKGRRVEYYSSEQGLHNLTLKAAVAENEELLTTLHELQEEQVTNSRNLLAQRNRNREERVREFDEGYRWPDSSGMTQQQLVDRFQLKLSMDRIRELGEIRHPQLTPLFAALEELLSVRISASRRQQREMEIKPLQKAYFQKGDHCDFHDCEMKLHDFVHTDVFQYIKGELARSGERMKTLLAQFDEIELMRDQALKADDIPKANELHTKSVDVLDKLIAAVRDRLSQIMLSSDDSGNFRGRFEKWRDGVKIDLEESRKDKESLKADILVDLEALAQHGEQAARVNEDALAVFAQYQHQSNQKLAENAKKQDLLWEKIQDMVHDMKKLGDQRFVEVNIHMQKTEDEEKRKREYAEFSEVYAEHCRLMEELLKNTDSAIRMVSCYDEFFAHGCKLVEAKDCEEELRDIRLAELRRYLEFYRKYVHVSGDLIIRKRARLKGVNRQMRNTKAQLEMCTESLDPNRTIYKDELKAQSQLRDEIDTTLKELQQKFEDQRKDFQPTEDLLEELGEEFVPPIIEHDEMETTRRAQMLEYQKKVAQGEADEVDNEQTAVRKLGTGIKMGKEATEKKREARKRGNTPQRVGGPGSPSKADAP